MKPWIDARAWVAAALLACALAAQSAELPVQDRYDEFIRAIDTQSSQLRSERVASLGAVFDAMFPVDTFRDMDAFDDEEVTTSFLAAANAVRMIGRDEDVRRAELAFNELLSRGIASAREYSYMHGAYIQMRMLEEAVRFQARHPEGGVTPVPIMRRSQLVPGEPTELALGSDGETLVHRTVHMSSPVQAVVVAHPGCRFSREAMLAIEGDPVLASALAEAK